MAEVQTLVKAEVNRQLALHLTRHHTELEQVMATRLAEQDEAIHRLDKQGARLSLEDCPRRGGLPWTLLVLGGAVYYLWRNPEARQKLMGAVQQRMPQVREKLQQVGQKVQLRTEVSQGSPAPAPATDVTPPLPAGVDGIGAAPHATGSVQDLLQPTHEEALTISGLQPQDPVLTPQQGQSLAQSASQATPPDSPARTVAQPTTTMSGKNNRNNRR